MVMWRWLGKWADELQILAMAVALIAGGVWLATHEAEAKTLRSAHVGSIVVFVHYNQYAGEKWAALMIEDPRQCPPTAPPTWFECANLKIWKRELTQSENPTLVLEDGTEAPTGHHVYTGDDNKIGVPHDPTGKEGRTWHLWGEAPGEEIP